MELIKEELVEPWCHYDWTDEGLHLQKLNLINRRSSEKTSHCSYTFCYASILLPPRLFCSSLCSQSATEGAGSYYHLNHSELVALLVRREAELETQKAEFERQKSLLAKREVELRKLKPQVRDLEDYIDTLLVRIMEQKPTLLQVRSKLKWRRGEKGLQFSPHLFTLTSTTAL